MYNDDPPVDEKGLPKGQQKGIIKIVLDHLKKNLLGYITKLGSDLIKIAVNVILEKFIYQLSKLHL